MSVDTTHTHSSSSSAIELIPTSANIPGTPNSPSLLPSPDSRNSFARRRLSWGRADSAGPPPMNDPGPSSSRPSTSSIPVYALDDDPFVASNPRANLDDPFRPSITSHYDDPDPFAYPSNTHTYASSASLISTSRRNSSPTSSTVDDFTHLTATLSTTNMNPNNELDVPDNNHDHDDWRTDSEQHILGDATPRTRRRLEQRYTANLSPSPIQRSGTAIKRLSQGLRRVSWRVVNFAGAGLDDHIRLPDGGDQVDATGDGRRRPSPDNDEDGDDRSVQPFADLGGKVSSLRGRTLCWFGPTSRFGERCMVFLYSQPLILCSIIFYAVLLTIQSSRTLTLSTPNATPPAVKGYFHMWEDYIIFALFVFFSFESFARICVSGLILDPEVPIRAILAITSTRRITNPRQPHQSLTPPRPPLQPASAAKAHSSIAFGISTAMSRDLLRFLLATLRGTRLPPLLWEGRLHRLLHLASHSSDPSLPTVNEPTPRLHSSKRPSSSPPRSTSRQQQQQQPQEKEVLLLPFQFSVNLARRVTRRNLPYLRHSWTRTDAVSVVAFWITFVLAQTGVEHSATRHLGLFRALSVLRTARLLSITSGTTTIMQSLKTARPLLVSVAYFVLFAMTLFSIIGVQSFNGSMLRSCYLKPVLGEGETSLNHFCGGHVDPNTLSNVPYITQDGRNVTVKGYICPLGQVCK
ncbi:Ion transport protein-domain-containing protein, partial [Russula emetica]